jgi:hypothetical protein
VIAESLVERASKGDVRAITELAADVRAEIEERLQEVPD